MSRIKSFLMEQEEFLTGPEPYTEIQSVHPALLPALSAIRPPNMQPMTRVSTSLPSEQVTDQLPALIWGLYAHGRLTSAYLHEETAKYDMWLCTSSHTHEEADQYEVRPITFVSLTIDQLRGEL